MNIEDLLNKEDLNKISNQILYDNIQSNKGKVNNFPTVNKKEDPNNVSINDSSGSNKNKNYDNILFKVEDKNIVDNRLNKSDNFDSASVMNQDSTISNAHISIIQGTKQ